MRGGELSALTCEPHGDNRFAFNDYEGRGVEHTACC